MRYLFIFLLTGCSQNNWEGAANRDLYADLHECAAKRDAYMFTQPEKKAEIFGLCMSERGWRKG